MKDDKNQSVSECNDEAAIASISKKATFEPTITKIAAPLKPRGVHAGIIVSVSGKF